MKEDFVPVKSKIEEKLLENNLGNRTAIRNRTEDIELRKIKCKKIFKIRHLALRQKQIQQKIKLLRSNKVFKKR